MTVCSHLTSDFTQLWAGRDLKWLAKFVAWRCISKDFFYTGLLTASFSAAAEWNTGGAMVALLDRRLGRSLGAKPAWHFESSWHLKSSLSQGNVPIFGSGDWVRHRDSNWLREQHEEREEDGRLDELHGCGGADIIIIIIIGFSNVNNKSRVFWGAERVRCFWRRRWGWIGNSFWRQVGSICTNPPFFSSHILFTFLLLPRRQRQTSPAMMS